MELTPEHRFVPVPHQTGCARCGYARGHHPTGTPLTCYRVTIAHADGQVHVWERYAKDITKAFIAATCAALREWPGQTFNIEIEATVPHAERMH